MGLYSELADRITATFPEDIRHGIKVEAKEILPPVTSEGEHSHHKHHDRDLRHAHTLSFSISSTGDIPPAEMVAAIQDSLGEIPVIKEQYQGLRNPPDFQQQVAQLEQKFPATNDAMQGLTIEDINAMRQWRNDHNGRYEAGEHIVFNTEKPAEMILKFGGEDAAAAAGAARENLEARAPAIVQMITDNAAELVTDPAKLEELKNLRTDLKEMTYDETFGRVRMEFGIPDAGAQDKNPDGSLPLKASGVLNELMEQYPDRMKQIIEHSVVFAGDDWLQGLPYTANARQMGQYIQSRADSLQENNPELGNELNRVLTDQAFDRKNGTAGEFAILSPDFEHPDYRVNLKLTDEITADKLVKALLQSAPEEMLQAEKANNAVSFSRKNVPAPSSTYAEKVKGGEMVTSRGK